MRRSCTVLTRATNLDGFRRLHPNERRRYWGAICRASGRKFTHFSMRGCAKVHSSTVGCAHFVSPCADAFGLALYTFPVYDEGGLVGGV